MEEGWGSGVRNASPSQCSPAILLRVGISPQNFLTFIFNPFVTLLYNFKTIPSISSRLLNLNQDQHPLETLWKC